MNSVGSAALVSVALALAGGPAAGALAREKHDPGTAAAGTLEPARTKLSDRKHYRASVAPRKGPARINVMHAWVLTRWPPSSTTTTGPREPRRARPSSSPATSRPMSCAGSKPSCAR